MHLWFSHSEALIRREQGKKPFSYYRTTEGQLVQVTLAQVTKDNRLLSNDADYRGRGRYVTTSLAEKELSGLKRKRFQ